MDALLAVFLHAGTLTRWHAASASAFLEANAGLQYVFGDVSGSLRSRLGYTQRQIDGLGTAKARAELSIPALRAWPRLRPRSARLRRAAPQPAYRQRRSCGRAQRCTRCRTRGSLTQPMPHAAPRAGLRHRSRGRHGRLHV